MSEIRHQKSLVVKVREGKGCKSKLAFLSLCPKLALSRGGPSGKSAGGDRRSAGLQHIFSARFQDKNSAGLQHILNELLQYISSAVGQRQPVDMLRDNAVTQT